MIMQLEHISKSFGGRQLFRDVTFRLEEYERLALVGPNGAGKTTMLNIISGAEDPDEGRVLFAKGARVGYLEQEAIEMADQPIFEEVMSSQVEVLEAERRLHKLEAELGEAPTPQQLAAAGRARDAYEVLGGYTIEAKVRSVMFGLGFKEDDLARCTTEFSGGWQMRIALAKLLIRNPEVLLLDEPTNHLDAESVLWLEQFLRTYPGAVLAVTHDRYFLDNVAEWICEVDRGSLFPYKGNYSTYLETKAARLEGQGQREEKLAKRLRSELEWVRSSPKARQAKSKARIERYEQMAAEARSFEKASVSDITIPVPPRLGAKVIEAKHIRKAFGDRVLIDDLSFTLPQGGIVGVIGPNGVGKSTLFKAIVGLEPLSGGELEIGESVSISYVDQNREGIDPNKKLWEVVSDGLDYMKVGDTEIPSRAYVASFGFKGPDQQKPAGVLSGGERNRLNLALTLKQGGNLLLLDEPTNDLDVETLESLEEALLAFPGCVVVTSHDRWFLDRIATHILAWEGTDENPGNWHWFEGNFDDYQKNRVERLGEEAARPHRIHRKLTRD